MIRPVENKKMNEIVSYFSPRNDLREVEDAIDKILLQEAEGRPSSTKRLQNAKNQIDKDMIDIDLLSSSLQQEEEDDEMHLESD